MIDDIETKIREIINSPRRQFAIMRDRRSWFQICASLDTFGDTELAIQSYDSISTARLGEC